MAASSSSSASSAAAACARASVAAAMVVVLACVLAGEGAHAAEHPVGGAPGWSLPSMSNVNYTAWADSQTFAVGDTLYFNYSKEYHNVVQLANQSAYASCDVSDPEHKWADGATTVPLASAGTFYFSCSFPTHCDKGQKVAVMVSTSSSSANSTASNSTAPGSASALPPSPPPLLLLLPLSLIILISALL